MDKQSFWQRLRITDNKMVLGIILGLGMGAAMSVALGDWGTNLAIGVGIGTALGAGWSQQTKNSHKEN